MIANQWAKQQLAQQQIKQKPNILDPNQAAQVAGAGNLFGVGTLNPVQQQVQPTQQQTQQTTTDNDGDGVQSNGGLFGSLMGLVPGGATTVGAVAGIGQALADNLSGNSWQRRREKEVDEALLQNLGNRERLLARNPEAERRLASMQVQNAMSGAQASAMNAAAGQGQYSGGDVEFAAGAGARNSAMAQGAAAPYAQQLAGLYGQKAQDEAQIAGQLDQNTMQRGQLAEMTAYIEDSGNNPFANLLTGAWKGAGLLHGIKDMDTKTMDVEQDANGNVAINKKKYK